MTDTKKVAEIADSLTEAQRAMLNRICATNGGGVPAKFNYRREPQPPFAKLYDLDLIQGKSGRQEWAVHTRLGLAVRSHITGE